MAIDNKSKPQAAPTVETHYGRTIARLHKHGYEVKPGGDGRWITVMHSEKLQAFLKVYDEPSKWGIGGGHISKLEVRADGKWLYNFDRGLDFNDLGQHPTAEDFFNTILAIAN